MMYSLAKQWNSKWLKSTRNSKTLLFLTKLLSKLNLNSRRKKSSSHLLLDEHFGREVMEALPAWKKYIGVMLREGLPVPVLSAALNYFLGLTTNRSPANMIQAMRDYFGAHTFERVDSPRGEFFHEHWEDNY